ncbi:MAG: hypothetical protein WBW04_11620, partial [Nitrolancea sp.]
MSNRRAVAVGGCGEVERLWRWCGEGQAKCRADFDSYRDLHDKSMNAEHFHRRKRIQSSWVLECKLLEYCAATDQAIRTQRVSLE